MIENIKKVLEESKDSISLMFGYVGKSSGANVVLLKYADLLEAFIDDKPDLFKQDAAILICHPLKYIIEAKITMLTNCTLAAEMKLELHKIMELAVHDPFNAKIKLKKMLGRLE